VLLRGFDDRGFCFYTNYESRKGRELTDNPHAALTFHWTVLERQVRLLLPLPHRLHEAKPSRNKR
jgi:pyridoxamine 5'-phosphate oxidase